MRVLITGSRNYGEFKTTKGEPRDRKLAIDEMKFLNVVLHFYKPTYIIQGGATGADHMARRWANANNVEHTEMKFRAEWNKYGRGAGPIRNTMMLDENKDLIDLVIAFDGGDGTANMVMQSKKRGIEVIEPKISNRP